MSKAVSTTRHSMTNRSVTLHRRVMVPDRMIVKHTNGTSPIINMQSSSVVKPVAKKKQVTRQTPIAASKVHANTLKNQQKHVIRPVKPKTEASVGHAMSSMLNRHKTLPRHLARTASRAHLLSQIVQPEPQKQRWHQRIFAGLTS